MSPFQASQANRCYAALLFCDLCGYTSLNEMSDPEDVATFRRGVETTMHALVEQHHGVVLQFVGDGMLALFGYPESSAACVPQALRAAVALRNAAARLEVPATFPAEFRAQFHIGVQAGLVFIREGDGLRGRYELTGDAVNTAARLCAHASPNEVLVSQDALRGHEGFFEYEERPPLACKGKREPIAVCSVLDVTQLQTRFDARRQRGLTPFAGREPEMKLLVSALDDERKKGALCVLGDAGIGKTRLLHEMGNNFSKLGVTAYFGFCAEYGGTVPLRPFLDILRQLLRVSSPVADHEKVAVEAKLSALGAELAPHQCALRQLLFSEPRMSASDSSSERALVNAVVAVLVAECACHPSAFVLDDWQWADSASELVLAALARTEVQDRIPIFVGARTIDTTHPTLANAEKIELAPLSFPEVQHMLAQRSSVAEVAAAGIYHRSGGNPLFAEEICSTLEDAKWAHAELPPIPSTVHGVIQDRLTRMAPRLNDILSAAAIIGGEFTAQLLQAITDGDDVQFVLEKLEDMGMILQLREGLCRFKHGITRDVVYAGIRVDQRRKLHRATAEAIEREFTDNERADFLEALATHWAEANESQRAMGYAERSGDKAAALCSLEQARLQYEAALRHHERCYSGNKAHAHWFAIIGKWSAVCVFNPSRAQLQVLHRADQLAIAIGDQAAQARIEYWRGWIRYALGEQAQAIKHLDRARGLAEQVNDQRLVDQVLSNLGQCYAARGDYQQALRLLHQGISSKQRRSSKNRGNIPVGAAYALGCLALICGERGDFEEAYAKFDQALEMVQHRGHAIEGSLLGLLGMVQVWQGEYALAAETAALGQATAERVAGRYVLAFCRLIAAYSKLMLGIDVEQSLEELAQAVRWLEQREIHLYLSFALAHLAHARWVTGDALGATPVAEKALSLSEQDDPMGECLAACTLAKIAANRGDQDSARSFCQRALDAALRRGSARAAAISRLTLAEVKLSSGEELSAHSLLKDLPPAFQKMRMPHHQETLQLLLPKLSRSIGL